MEKYSTNYCLLLIVFLPFALTYGPRDASLYSDEDPLWQLDSTNFKKVVFGKNNAWIIEFYNNWCGHCIRFAPVWKQFATETNTWKKVIDVGAINCNDQKNIKICRHYEVDSFPTIKLFWHNTSVSDQGEVMEGSRDISGMENSILDFLDSKWNQGVPPTWPDIKAMQVTSLKEITEQMKNPGEFMDLFVEFPGSYIGRKIILDLSFQNEVVIGRVSTESDTLMRDLKVEVSNDTIPTFLKVLQTSDVNPLISFSADKNESYIRDKVFESIIGSARHKTVMEEKQKPKGTKLTIIDAVYRADIENAVYHALHQEIGVSKSIRDEELSTLNAFLLVLKKYFPGDEPTMKFLNAIHSWVSRKKTSIRGEEFVQAVDKLQNEEQHLPKMREDYVACKGSEPRYRGYPCSLWTLFHTLTIQADALSNKNKEEKNDGHVLFVIRDYVKHFFTCKECSKHFLKMAEKVESQVENNRDAVLWLWEAHNRVNRRLAGDETEDPKYPKIQFPSVLVCPKCQTRNGADVSWVKESVLQYLRKFYNRDNILDLEYVRVQYMFTGDEGLRGVTTSASTESVT